MELINKEILKSYDKMDSVKLAKKLGISVEYLRVRASRLHKRRGDKANAIINGKKLCALCGRTLPVSEFYKDRYQPNNLDYYCKKCRRKKLEDKEEKTVSNTTSNGKRKWGFGLPRSHNPVIYVKGVASLRCKNCGIIKPLDEFHRASSNKSGRMNFCKKCRANNKE